MDGEKAGLPGRNPQAAVGCVVVEHVERFAERDGEALVDALVPLGGLPVDGCLQGEIDAEHRELVVAPAPAGAGEVLRELLLADEVEKSVPRVEIRDENPRHRNPRAVRGLDRKWRRSVSPSVVSSSGASSREGGAGGENIAGMNACSSTWR